MLSDSSLSNASQMLNILEKKGLVFKVARSIWAETGKERLSPYNIIPFLMPKNRAYVSFISALHLYGIIEQIPQEINLASTIHTKKIYIKVGTFSIHQITPSFFDGFDWYKGNGSFLIAEPEKALINSLYLFARKKNSLVTFQNCFSLNHLALRKPVNGLEKSRILE